MFLFVTLLLAAQMLAVQEPPSPLALPQLLSRVAEEAEVFQQNAPKSLTLETLEQRALMPPSRFHPRIGKAAMEVPKPRLQVREIVSEYSVGTLKESTTHSLSASSPPTTASASACWKISPNTVWWISPPTTV